MIDKSPPSAISAKLLFRRAAARFTPSRSTPSHRHFRIHPYPPAIPAAGRRLTSVRRLLRFLFPPARIAGSRANQFLFNPRPPVLPQHLPGTDAPPITELCTRNKFNPPYKLLVTADYVLMGTLVARRNLSASRRLRMSRRFLIFETRPVFDRSRSEI